MIVSGEPGVSRGLELRAQRTICAGHIEIGSAGVTVTVHGRGINLNVFVGVRAGQ